MDRSKTEMVDIDRLHELFNYDPEAGVFYWRRNDKAAGCQEKSRGNLILCVDGVNILGHRAAWAMTYGEWPNIIDHIDRNPSNNRISNLRSVTSKVNGRNSSLQTNNKSGVMGVYWDSNRSKWSAQIKIDGRSTSLGRFDSKGMAAVARAKANLMYGFDLFHGLHRPK